jgi:hypothetical protein
MAKSKHLWIPYSAVGVTTDSWIADALANSQTCHI